MIGYFVRHPVAANLLMVLVIVFGITVISGIERETFPAFTSDSVNISVSYPARRRVTLMKRFVLQSKAL